MSDGGSTTVLVLLIVVLFAIVLATLWIGITLLISLIGGWRALARRYPAPQPPPKGQRLTGVTGMFGITSYKRVLIVTTTENGLLIENRAIFRPGHPPLFIPFSDMHNLHKQTLFFWDYAAFDVGDPTIASLRLPSKVFEGTNLVFAR